MRHTVRTPVAQTNLQLYAQALASGWPPEALARLAAGRRLAARLFASATRANSKPFLAHLIGVASLLDATGATPDVALAGLLHAAYAQGDFEGRGPGIHPHKRALVSAAIGAEGEALVVDYERFGWSRDDIARHAAASGAPAPREAILLHMRLANEIEDCLDGGLVFGGKNKYAGDPSRLPAMQAIAARLGRPEMGDRLEAEIAAGDALRPPDVLRGAGTVSDHGASDLTSDLLALARKMARRTIKPRARA
jgi:hypothetical protein